MFRRNELNKTQGREFFTRILKRRRKSNRKKNSKGQIGKYKERKYSTGNSP